MISYNVLVTFLLVASLSISLVLIWYCRKLVLFIGSYNQMISVLLDSLTKFEEHIASVYNRETFYGDTTLQNLLTHARQVNEEIKTFIDENEDIFTIEETNEKEDQE
jgi:hypothetical protein